ncbi:MAG: hypothetical protein OXI19_08700 [Gemmatimonadota bacterium]|nr:hypothetical protein [Gemmatimonadota bacterium]
MTDDGAISIRVATGAGGGGGGGGGGVGGLVFVGPSLPHVILASKARCTKTTTQQRCMLFMMDKTEGEDRVTWDVPLQGHALSMHAPVALMSTILTVCFFN